MAHPSQPAYTSTHEIYDALPSGKDPRPNAVDTYFKTHLHSADYHNALEAIHRDSLVAGLPDIACSAPQAKFLMLQARMCNAKRILEVGTLGGYSAAWFAMTSPQTKVTTVELDPHYATVARQNLEKAGLGERVEILQGLGTTVLQGIKEEVHRGEREKFDFAFIDANKQDNLAYFKVAMDITRERAVIIVDNVVRDGRVASAEEAEKDDRVKGTRDLIEGIGEMKDIEATAIQTVGEKNYDGFLIALKK
ncbi:S-adenosyl-L-methionine-dependent methyltransferase [Penicillium sp. IBT 35674x]|nr:S-adenosyl-L-methionine-dependent methyltransferase [Penicillium sp. IBT 35674x]